MTILTPQEYCSMYIAEKDILEYNRILANFFRDKPINWMNSIKSDETVILASLLKKYAPNAILETGTNIGVSTAVLALFAPEAHIITYDIPEIPCAENLVYSLDNWGWVFRGTELEKRIDKRNKSTYDVKIEEIEKPATFFFLDSDHSLLTIRIETELAMNVLKRDKNAGVIVYHDAIENAPWHTDVHAFLRDNYPDSIIVNTQAGIGILEVKNG